MVKLFVGGFPLDIDEMELVKLFMPFGQVSTVKIVRDKKTRICKGYAFLEVSDHGSALEMINNLDGSTLGDRNLAVSIRDDEDSADKPISKRPKATVPASYVKVRKSGEPEKKKRPRRSGT